jgi:hypothetical protein
MVAQVDSTRAAAILRIAAVRGVIASFNRWKRSVEEALKAAALKNSETEQSPLPPRA